jgi:hypothetical protein
MIDTMKKLSILLPFILITQISFGQKAVDRFISKNLKEDHTMAMSFPGWLFESTLKLAAKMDDDEEFKEYATLAEYVKNIRVFVAKENHNIPESTVQDLIQKMIHKEGYDEYIRVRSKGTNVNLFAIEENETIKRLVFFIDDSDETFIMLRLKLNLPYNAFKKLSYKLNEEIRP